MRKGEEQHKNHTLAYGIGGIIFTGLVISAGYAGAFDGLLDNDHANKETTQTHSVDAAQPVGDYLYIPQPVHAVDMGDPHKVVEAGVDAIKANDPDAFGKLVSPEFMAQIGGEAGLKELVQKHHDGMFEGRASDIIEIEMTGDDEGGNFFIDANGRGTYVNVVKFGNEFHIEEW